MSRPQYFSVDIIITTVAVAVVAGLLGLAMLTDELQVASDLPLSTILLRQVLVVWLFMFAVLAPKRMVLAICFALGLSGLGLFVSSSVFADRSNLYSVVGMLAILVPARLCGLRLSAVHCPTVSWRPSILQLFAITAAAAGIFALGQLTYQYPSVPFIDFTWSLLLNAMLLCTGMILLSNYSLVSRAALVCLVCAPIAFALAQPHRIDLELSAAVLAELGVSLGWCIAIFGATHCCGWKRLSRASADDFDTLTETQVDTRSMVSAPRNEPHAESSLDQVPVL